MAFFNHISEIVMFLVILPIIAIVFFVAGVVLSLQANNVGFVPIGMGFAVIILIIIELFINKNTLSKISFDYDGISVSWLKQRRTYIRWNEIKFINEISRSKTFSWLSFVTKEKQINIELTKNIYNAIMHFCPIQSIKNKINSIECFKWFHRNNKK